MKQLKASTKRGKEIIRKAKVNEGYFLSDIYRTYSNEKLNTWKWCEYQYLTSDRGKNFRICSHSRYRYTVAWECYYNGQRALRMETKANTYIVYLDM